ncbi:MAG: alpha/beta hydrolase [Methanomicrobiales archaeon]|nr:alpha/beta hydrolase [Methanomicrobiales archaeon]
MTSPCKASGIFPLLAILLLVSGCISPDVSPGTAAPEGNPAPADLIEQIRNEYPAPGDLYDVDGARMHLRCMGNGTPTVIMEAGSGDCSLSWILVQQNVSPFTRVCTYDRAGYGWSDPLPGPVTARNVTGRLHTLLSQADIPAPYVLAGHSLGGIYVRSYAHRYPGEVAGLVLVDPGSEWQAARTGEDFTREMQGAISTKTALLRAMGREASQGTFARNLTLVEPYCNKKLPPWEYRAYRALWATEPWFWDSCAVEGESAFAIWDEVARENITSVGAIPLVVISSGKDMGFSADPEKNAHALAVFRTLQEEMAAGSSQGRYLVAADSSHYVQLDQPDLVTQSIRQVVMDVRNSTGSR